MEPPIKILFCIIKKQKTKEACEILNQKGACGIYVFPARGYGHNSFLNFMGLEDLEVDLLVCPIRESVSTETIIELTEKLELKKDNQGLAFSIKIGAISKNALYGLLNVGKENEIIMGQTKQKNEQESSEEQSKEEENKNV